MYPIFTQFLNFSLSWLTVLAQLLSLFLLVVLFVSKGENSVIRLVKKYGMLAAFIIVMLGVVGSLAYSNILMYNPCVLCWYQRILMYPQLLILGIGLVKKDSSAVLYSLALSIIGIPLSLYHYMGQRGAFELGCSTVGISESCSKVFKLNLGYITIPLMAFSAFLLISLILLIVRSKVPNKS